MKVLALLAKTLLQISSPTWPTHDVKKTKGPNKNKSGGRGLKKHGGVKKNNKADAKTKKQSHAVGKVFFQSG